MQAHINPNAKESSNKEFTSSFIRQSALQIVSS